MGFEQAGNKSSLEFPTIKHIRKIWEERINAGRCMPRKNDGGRSIKEMEDPSTIFRA